VRQFQHDNALYEDGTVGPHTWATLAGIPFERGSRSRNEIDQGRVR
jgi:murein L,D-transpeptidase YcbB/YkuD